MSKIKSKDQTETYAMQQEYFKRLIASAVKATDADFDRAIQSIHKKADTLQMDVHRLLVGLLARFTETGDVRPMVKHVNMLLHKLPAGVRSNAIKAWVEVHMGLVWAVEGEHKNTFIAAKRKAKDCDLRAAANERWFEMQKEPDYKPMNFEVLLNNLLTKAGKADASKGDEVDAGMLAAIRKAVHEYKQANAFEPDF